jgi:hypothetical protein
MVNLQSGGFTPVKEHSGGRLGEDKSILPCREPNPGQFNR